MKHIPWLILLAALCTCASCVEQRIIAVRGPANLPGAEGGIRPNTARGGDMPRTWEDILGDSLPPTTGTPVDGKPFRFLSADRTVILQSHSPRQLMIHLSETLREGEDDLLYDQLLADELKNAYRSRGMNPREAVSFLKDNADGVFRLLSLFPLGEQTPGVMMLGLGRGAYRLSTPGGVLAEGHTFRSMDIVFERGGFRLLMLN